MIVVVDFPIKNCNIGSKFIKELAELRKKFQKSASISKKAILRESVLYREDFGRQLLINHFHTGMTNSTITKR